MLLALAVAELFAMALWFSASAVAPELAVVWDLTPTQTGLLTSAVRVGLVVGALLSAALALSDTIPPRHLFAGSALAGAVITALLAAVVESAPPPFSSAFSRVSRSPAPIHRG